LREKVEVKKARLIMIDSTAGYQLAIRDDDIVSRLHALCKYLQSQAVAVVVITEIGALSEVHHVTDQRFSYLADNVILLRHWECQDQQGHLMLRKILMILKKRLSSFDRSVHELEIGPTGIQVKGPVMGISTFFGKLSQATP
jgi:circadian clock protein KaiC